MNNYSQYIRWLVVFLLSQILGIVVFNLAVDPYGIIDSPKIYRLNHAKPQQEPQVRLYKAVAITQVRPKTILLGSSRTDVGLNPNHPVLQSSQPVYNLGILGANMYEVKRYFNHAIANQPDLNQVVLGLDFFMFNENRKNTPDFYEQRLEIQRISLKDMFDISFSTNTIKSSILTILANVEDPDLTPYTENGLRNERYFINKILPNQSKVKGFEVSLENFLTSSDLYKKYELSESGLANLREIIDICKQKNIQLKIFISPAHATQWEAMINSDLWPVFEIWKREIVKITPFWDFSGYNSITTEPISEEMKYYLDSSHYRQIVGDLVLDRIFQGSPNPVPEDFGVLVTPENIESHLKAIRQQREDWKKNNLETVEYVKQLKK